MLELLALSRWLDAHPDDGGVLAHALVHPVTDLAGGVRVKLASTARGAGLSAVNGPLPGPATGVRVDLERAVLLLPGLTLSLPVPSVAWFKAAREREYVVLWISTQPVPVSDGDDLGQRLLSADPGTVYAGMVSASRPLREP